MPRAPLLFLLLLCLATPVLAATAATEDDDLALFDRLAERERVLDAQRNASADIARQRALFAYRLLRRRDLGFAANPEARLEDARALELALMALRRASDETRAIARELERVESEREALENAVVAQSLGHLPADQEAAARKKAARAGRERDRLLRPVRGVALAVPGLRRDRPTNVELRHDSVTFLTRLNAPVHAVAAGVVQRVEALSQGGFAIVSAHAGGLTSIVTGLRDVAVKAGDSVDTGQTVGLAGRSLDGASVVSVELWRKRRPADTAGLLRVHM